MSEIRSCEASIDGISFRLKEPFDFSFLKKYGRVFKVLYEQDSGNICFGVGDGRQKYFVKFAGALTINANVSTEEAISVLKKSARIYHDLAHPNLVRLVCTDEITCGAAGSGFVAVFEWEDATCMGKQYPQEHQQFMALPLMTRVKIFEEILSFHAHVAAQGYVAIDFYRGSIMYSLAKSKTIICDIDFYEKMPYINQMGRLWGSSSFMSPEEFTLGAEIDEVTNVYVMGATAFALFADSNRNLEKWPLDIRLYDIVKKATSDERVQRQQSIRQLIEEWEAAKQTAIAPSI